MSTHKIIYGSTTITFSLKRSKRKTLEIAVLPDLSVVATAPMNIDLSKVMRKVHKRADWILAQQEYFSAFLPQDSPRKYVSGETHKYLGRQYRLKLEESNKNDVKLKGKYIYIHTRKKEDKVYNETLLYKWYKAHAELKFNQILEKCYEKLKKYGIEKPALTIKKMKSRWGSCQPEKLKFILNIELIKAPSHCIEYVVMHELCHIKYSYHNEQFYHFLSQVMPDWQDRKKRLEGIQT